MNRSWIKIWIVIGLVGILIVSNIVSLIKYNKLQNDFLILETEILLNKNDYESKNSILKSEIKELANTICFYEYKIDSLTRIKNTIVVKEPFHASVDLIEGSDLLKQNLLWEKY